MAASDPASGPVAKPWCLAAAQPLPLPLPLQFLSWFVGRNKLAASRHSGPALFLDSHS